MAAHEGDEQIPWRITLFGDPGIAFRGQPTGPFKTRKVAHLLLIIAAQPGRIHSRDSLAEALWPGEFIDIARDRFRQTLHRLIQHFRDAGGECPFDITRTTVQVQTSNCDIDLTEFYAHMENAERSHTLSDRQVHFVAATNLVTLPFADGIVDDWVRDIREGINGMIVKAAQALSANWIERGEYERAIEVADRGLRTASLDENLNLTKVEALRSSGKAAEASQLIQSYESRLYQSLTLRPSKLWRERTANAQIPEPEAASQIWISVGRPIDSFYGRDEEIEFLSEKLGPDSPTRLVTVIGPGGTGKTRLISEFVSTKFETENVLVIGLAELESASQFVNTLAGALEVTIQSGGDLGTTLAPFFKSGTTLLVLDNCEHLMPDIVVPIKSLLQGCPGIKILATSRLKLGIHGEQQLVLSALEVPQDEHLEESSHFPSVNLLVDRIRNSNHSFAPTPDEYVELAKLAIILDGIPLAIELAATQISYLTVSELRTNLEGRVVELANQELDLPTRHLTLRETLRWGFEHLSVAAQSLLVRLAIFPGTWMVEDALAVTKVDDVPRLLDELRRFSMIRLEVVGHRRFTLSPIVRQFCREKLTEETVLELELNHFHHYFKLVVDVHEGDMSGTAKLGVFQIELANIRHAFQTCVRDSDLQQHAAVFIGRTFGYVEKSGLIHEWASLIRDLPSSPSVSRSDQLVLQAYYAYSASFFADQEETTRVIASIFDMIPGAETPYIKRFVINQLNTLIWRGERNDYVEAALHLVESVYDPNSKDRSDLILLMGKCELFITAGEFDQAMTLLARGIVWALEAQFERELTFLVNHHAFACLQTSQPNASAPFLNLTLARPYMFENMVAASYIIRMASVVIGSQTEKDEVKKSCVQLLGYADRQFQRYSIQWPGQYERQAQNTIARLSSELDDIQSLLESGRKFSHGEAVEVARSLISEDISS